MNNLTIRLPEKLGVSSIRPRKNSVEENSFSFLERDAVRGFSGTSIITLGYSEDEEIPWLEWK